MATALALSPGGVTAAEPEAAEPEAAEPEAAEPEAAEPEAGPTPEAAEPEAAEPKAAEPKAAPTPESAPPPEPEGPVDVDAAVLEAERLAPPPREYVAITDALSPRTGEGMLIAGSTAVGLGLVGQMVGYAMLHDACKNLEQEVIADRDFNYAVTCGQGVAGGAALLFFSGIAQLGGAPWIIAGLSERGRHRSFEDAFELHGRKPVTKRRARILTGVGGGLLGAGLALWVVSPVSAIQGCKASPSLTCSVDATTWGWNAGLGLITAGASMVTYGVAYRRGYGTFRAIRNAEAAPMVLTSPTGSGGQVQVGGGGVSLSGRF